MIIILALFLGAAAVLTPVFALVLCGKSGGLAGRRSKFAPKKVLDQLPKIEDPERDVLNRAEHQKKQQPLPEGHVRPLPTDKDDSAVVAAREHHEESVKAMPEPTSAYDDIHPARPEKQMIKKHKQIQFRNVAYVYLVPVADDCRNADNDLTSQCSTTSEQESTQNSQGKNESTSLAGTQSDESKDDKGSGDDGDNKDDE